MACSKHLILNSRSKVPQYDTLHVQGKPILSLCDTKSPFHKGGFRGNVNTLHMACSKHLILNSRSRVPQYGMQHVLNTPYATVRALVQFCG